LQPECLLDFVGAHIRILAVLKKARTVVVADELDEGGSIRLPVLREAFEILKDGVQARGGKERDGVLGVFVEVGVENARVLEVSVPFDLKEIPAQVVEFEYGKDVRRSGHGRLDISRILVEVLLGAGFDLRDDGEAV